ncbi:uncharacterized protein LOC128879761 [Hylaeus volcanicus]|uniref:uncharacterized protein LOC128879761 n=1 Tax=Hylaeus volcanicus TaxID=313075 RepID=UPI0023B85BB2|nr:uncharacterized protein LOC128879761 [Hylaeus volcanicus]XP_053985175.1 uncharacterized protein LOC128879761 [Hylaeus volcanicus]
MGNYLTKFISLADTEKEEMDVQPSMDEVNVKEDVMCTPTMDRVTLPTDPRSITIGINRTPIEVCKTYPNTPVGLSKRAITAIPRYLQAKPYLETDIDQVIPCLTPQKREPEISESEIFQFPDAQNKSVENPVTPVTGNLEIKMSTIERERYEILGIDPRSPAANFDRTPILEPKSLQRLRARSQLCLRRDGSYETDVLNSNFSYCETLSPFHIPEIQALPDLLENRLKLNFLINDSNNKSNDETHSEIGDSKEESKETTSEPETKNNVQNKEIHVNNNDTIKIWRDSSISDEPEKLEVKIPTDEKKNGNEIAKIRTPLGNRFNIGRVQASINSPQQTFKNKNVVPKMQENTPPHKRCVVRSKLSGIQWDSDSTIII